MSRPWLRRLLALMLGLAVVGGAELGLRVAGWPPDQTWEPERLALVVKDGVLQNTLPLPAVPRFVLDPATDELSTNPAHRATMRPSRFPRTPPADRPRLFVIGESAVVGQAGGGPPLSPAPPDIVWADRATFVSVRNLPDGPGVFPEAESLPARLAAHLAAAGHPAEVINMGRIAQDSDEHFASVKEAVELGADGIVLYYGNNESIGIATSLIDQPVPALQDTRSALRRFHLYRALFVLLPRPEVKWERLAGRSVDRAVLEAELPGRVVDELWTLANRPLVTDGLPDDIVHDAIVARFEHTFERILAFTRAKGVPVWFVACPPALHYPPFRSGHDPLASEAARADADEAARAALGAMLQRDGQAAVTAARRAVALDPGSARHRHLLAAAAETAGLHDEATEAALAALALDQSHKRSTPALRVAAERACGARPRPGEGPYVALGEGCAVGDAHADLVAEARQRGPFATYARFHSDFDHPLPAGHERLAGHFAALVGALPPRP